MPLPAPAPLALLLALLAGPVASGPLPATGHAGIGSEAPSSGGSAPARATVGAAAGVDPVGSWPLRPEPGVVAGFDPPDAPWGAGHRGVDLLGRPGQQVRAALAGRVSFAGQLAGRGVLVVDHGATRTTYEPVAAAVPVGTEVAAGAVVGRLQVAGSHCFPRACLHWGWREGETYLDPLRLVGRGPVRLLPLWREEPVPSRSTQVGAPSPPYAGWRPLAQRLRTVTDDRPGVLR